MTLEAPRRQIYHQGFFDGACFLYAIANAYKALTGIKVTRDKWDRAIERAPHPTRLLTGAGSTGLSYEEALTFLTGALAALADDGDAFDVEQLAATATTAEIGDAIGADSVVLFAFGGPTEAHAPEHHIVCGVAASDDRSVLHLACSAAFSSRHLRDGEYVERFHPRVGRYSNDAISADAPVRVAPYWRWRVVVRRGPRASGLRSP